MKEVRFFFAPDAAKNNRLSDDEAKHALRVLRLKVGDEIFLTDGKGHLYTATIIKADSKDCNFQIINCIQELQPWNGLLHLAVAPTKSIDRTEWLAEKATEIGFDRLTLLDCVFSERRVVNLERMERILLSGVKQSHKLNILQLDGITKFSEFIRQPFAGRKFIAHCYEQADLNPDGRPFLLDALKGSQEDTLVMVGPEGDFSVDEVRAALDAGYTPISLGESRLRTETAALVAVHLMNINNRKKHVCRN